jgi:alkylation response protein AidB-like acyl-CoA dehydrogenase
VTVVDRGAPLTAGHVLDAARALAPAIAERAAEVEAAREVPRDLLDALVAGGCFRMLLPRSHGGAGADLPSALRLFETLAETDASVAWTVMIGGSAWVDLAGLPRATFDGLFAGDAIVAGAFAPSGSITPVEGGYRVTGRWGFASGCRHATVLYGNCVDGVAEGPSGVPQMRMAVFTPDQVEIEDTWSVLGLRGTGSHHIRVVDAVVPADRTLRPLEDEPCLDEPVVRVPVPSLIAMEIASVAVGVAQGALEDAVALAAHKVPLMAGAPLAADALFQADLAIADTELRAVRALLQESAGALWATAVEGEPFTLRQRAQTRAAGVWATTRAAAVVETAYRSGGGTAIYRTCPLERRLRDIHALTQHFIVRQNTMATAGAVLAGQDVDVPIF